MMLKQLATALISSIIITHSAYAEPTELVVYTYESFTSEWGPGPKIKAAFEEQCDNCTVNFVPLDNSAGILNRVKLEGASSKADIVLGLDTNLMAEAESSGLLAPSGADLSTLQLPTPWTSEQFVPFDYGYFAFVYNTELMPTPPKSLDELVNAPDDLKIIIQDPRTSTPGLGMMLWMKKVYGDKTPEAWAKLKKKTLTVTKGWSEAYFSLFLNDEAPMVLSYSTSPAYHMAIDKTDKYQAAAFSEGHYLQIEIAAMLKNSKHPELAREFLQFILNDKFQEVLPLTNVMYPVTNIGDKLPEEFSRLIEVNPTLSYTPEEVKANRKLWIDEWLGVMSD